MSHLALFFFPFLSVSLLPSIQLYSRKLLWATNMKKWRGFNGIYKTRDPLNALWPKRFQSLRDASNHCCYIILEIYLRKSNLTHKPSWFVAIERFDQFWSSDFLSRLKMNSSRSAARLHFCCWEIFSSWRSQLLHSAFMFASLFWESFQSIVNKIHFRTRPESIV